MIVIQGQAQSGEGLPEDIIEMNWERSETLALANHRCTYCHGLGLLTGKRGRSTPCNCVLRGIFRVCLGRFRHCVMKEKHMSRVSLQRISGKSSRLTWGRKDEEYIADFYLVSKRHLDDAEFKIFKFHFLYGADWKLCCRKFNVDRGNFFHSVYRVQQKLGRVFRELTPYALYPLDEYFNGALRREVKPEDRLHQIPPVRLDRSSLPVTPPVKLAA